MEEAVANTHTRRGEPETLLFLCFRCPDQAEARCEIGENQAATKAEVWAAYVDWSRRQGGYSLGRQRFTAGGLRTQRARMGLSAPELAKLVGERTFGKGLVQTLFQLPAGHWLKLTTARWYTPVGRSIQRQAMVGHGEVGEFALRVGYRESRFGPAR